MSTLASPKMVTEISGELTSDGFAAMRKAAVPVVIRGLVADWPLVGAANEGDEAVVAYLSRFRSTCPVTAIAAPPRVKGRFFYSHDMTGLNFTSGQGRLEAFLSDLLTARDMPDAGAASAGGGAMDAAARGALDLYYELSGRPNPFASDDEDSEGLVG